LNTNFRDYFWDSSKYPMVSDIVIKENLNLLRVFSFLSAAVFAVITLFSFLIPSIEDYRIVYVIFMAVGIAIGVGAILLKPINEFPIKLLVYLFQLMLLSFGIVMGVVLDPNQASVSYIALLIAVPLLFTTRPLHSNIVTGLSIVVYIVAAHFTQPKEIFRLNLMNIIVYGLLSLLITSFFMRVKLMRFVYRKENNQIQMNTYEKTITDMLRESAGEDDADEILKNLLQFIGEKSNSDRAYIFEQNRAGNFDNTYEWCSPGVLPTKDALQNIDYEYIKSTWIQLFRNSHTISISDIKNYKSVNADGYDFLKSRNVKSLVAVQITIDGKMIGFYGVDNPPKESLQYLSELFKLVEFEFSTMIRLRNRTAAIEEGSIHDQLTGCKNRKALNWAYDKEYDPNKSFTIIQCDLNGLKEVNDKQGHDAGDRFICQSAETFCSVFGREHVYRMGGDEFAIVMTGKTIDEINDLIVKCHSAIGDRATMGVAYVEQMNISFEELMHQADMEMYRRKDMFYQTRRRYREVK